MSMPFAVMGACGILSLGAYIATLCPTVYVEGSGELIGAAYYLGTPHPTGYPLFALGARLLASLMPLGSPALQINAAAALFAAAGSSALAWLLCTRGVQPLVAASAGLCLAFSHTYWSQAIIAEVYGLSMMLWVLAMGWGLRASEQHSLRALLMAAWCMGLGLTAHLNQTLLVPGLLVLWAWRWPGLFVRGRYLLAGLATAGAAYSLVLYLPLRNGLGPGFHWGDLATAHALWDHLTGATYRSAFFSLPVEGMALNAQRWAEHVGSEWHALVLPIVVWGGIAAWRRDRSLFVMTGSGLLANLIIALNYHRDPNGIGVFFLVSYVCLALWLGLGLDDMARRFSRWGGRYIGVVVAAGAFFWQYGQVDLSENRVAERYGLDILEDLPPGSILVTEGDDVAFVLDYLLRVEKVRSDVTLYNRVGRGTDMLSAAERRLPAGQQQALQQRREAALARGPDPLFYLVRRRSPLANYAFVPSGLVYQLIPEGDARRAAALARSIEMANAEFAAENLDPWVRKIQSNYWFMLGEQARERADYAGALAAYGRAADVAFDSRTVQYNVGLMALRLGDVQRAKFHAEKAIAIDPFQPYGHQLMARIRQVQRQN